MCMRCFKIIDVVRFHLWYEYYACVVRAFACVCMCVHFIHRIVCTLTHISRSAHVNKMHTSQNITVSSLQMCIYTQVCFHPCMPLHLIFNSHYCKFVEKTYLFSFRSLHQLSSVAELKQLTVEHLNNFQLTRLIHGTMGKRKTQTEIVYAVTSTHTFAVRFFVFFSTVYCAYNFHLTITHKIASKIDSYMTLA